MIRNLLVHVRARDIESFKEVGKEGNSGFKHINRIHWEFLAKGFKILCCNSFDSSYNIFDDFPSSWVTSNV